LLAQAAEFYGLTDLEVIRGFEVDESGYLFFGHR
jgi:hypothetical protein